MNKLSHVSSLFSVNQNQCLCVGGVSVTQLASRVGGTPFFAYDRKIICDRMDFLRKIMPGDLKIHYSMKANPMPAVVQQMAYLVDGLDVASGGELQCALDTVIQNHCISFAGPGKTDAELTCAVASEVIIHVESELELQRLEKIGMALGLTPKVSIRVNPDFELRSSGMKMSGGAKPFGIDAECVPDILRNIATKQFDFHGFQIFCGSQNLQSEAIIEAQSKIFDLALRLSDAAPSSPRLLNIGGGFGIPYFPGEQALNIQGIAHYLHEAMARLKKALPTMSIAIESGRYLVGEAGIYVSKIIDRKISRGKIFLIVDGGMHHHLAASGNFGQVIRKNYPVLVGNKIFSTETEIVSIVGSSCTPLDILANQVTLSRAEVGDLVVVLQSGAYGLTASPVNFLSHKRALEVLV
jgi:diaminopimelate decarboxylase